MSSSVGHPGGQLEAGIADHGWPGQADQQRGLRCVQVRDEGSYKGIDAGGGQGVREQEQPRAAGAQRMAGVERRRSHPSPIQNPLRRQLQPAHGDKPATASRLVSAHLPEQLQRLPIILGSLLSIASLLRKLAKFAQQYGFLL